MAGERLRQQSRWQLLVSAYLCGTRCSFNARNGQTVVPGAPGVQCGKTFCIKWFASQTSRKGVEQKETATLCSPTRMNGRGGSKSKNYPILTGGPPRGTMMKVSLMACMIPGSISIGWLKVSETDLPRKAVPQHDRRWFRCASNMP